MDPPVWLIAGPGFGFDVLGCMKRDYLCLKCDLLPYTERLDIGLIQCCRHFNFIKSCRTFHTNVSTDQNVLRMGLCINPELLQLHWTGTLADVMEPLLMSWQEAHSSDHFQFCLKLEFKLAPTAIDKGNIMKISYRFLCCHICMFSSFNACVLVFHAAFKATAKIEEKSGCLRR